MKEQSELKLATIILAAGEGKRMKSSMAKVLHLVGGRPMLAYPVAVAKAVGSEKTLVVIGHQAEKIREEMKNENLLFVYQREQLGTGHAVLQAREALQDFNGHALILCGDVPLITPATIRPLLQIHREQKSPLTVLTTRLADPTGYGRVVRGDGSCILKVVEEKDASVEERKICEINTGIYCVERTFLFEALALIGNNNAQHEYYLTDIFEIAARRNVFARACMTVNSDEVMGVNTIEDLERANRIICQSASQDISVLTSNRLK